MALALYNPPLKPRKHPVFIAGSIMYDRGYQDLKAFSKNKENFCKQLRFVLQQRSGVDAYNIHRDLPIFRCKEPERNCCAPGAGDFIIIHQKDDNGWWYGTLKERKGHFPTTYVEEFPTSIDETSSEA